VARRVVRDAGELRRLIRRRRRSGLPARCLHSRSTSPRHRRHSERRSRQDAPPIGAQIVPAIPGRTRSLLLPLTLASPFIDKLGCCEREPVGTWNGPALDVLASTSLSVGHRTPARTSSSSGRWVASNKDSARSIKLAAPSSRKKRRVTRARPCPQRARPRRWLLQEAPQTVAG
jgi:hypothetical protein